MKPPESPLGAGWFREAQSGHVVNIGMPLNLKKMLMYTSINCDIYQVEKHKTKSLSRFLLNTHIYIDTHMHRYTKVHIHIHTLVILMFVNISSKVCVVVPSNE